MAVGRRGVGALVVVLCLVGVSEGSAGDADPVYRDCVGQCKKSGCAGEMCFSSCKHSVEDIYVSSERLRQLYLQWKQSLCQADCCYYCMANREKERKELGQGPVKYHGKWPFKRIFLFQEPASVVFSALNLVMHLCGWLSFHSLVYHKLPLMRDKKPYYEYTTLWHIYGFMSMNAWFWSALFHSRDVELTEKMDYSCAVAIIGYSLILALIRSFSLREEASRVMVAAPLLAFVTTHILFLNNFKFDYGWNMKVCVAMGVAQLLVWAVWAGVTRHPSLWKVWFVVAGGGLAMLLETYDFPPYEGLLDAHSLWHASTIPLTYLWWSFICDDVHFCTGNLVKKTK